MALSEKLQILITADGKAAQAEFNKLGVSAERSIGKTDDRLKQLSGQMMSLGATTVVAGGIAAAGLFKLAQSAGDLSEAQNKANVVLGTEGSAAVEKFANSAATAAGLSKRAATDAASSFAVFGKSAGLSGQGLADFSIELTQLAGDLASFSNTTPEEAVTAIGAALRGESEPIRQYGVLLDDATLKAEALAMGIYDGNGSLTQQQRVLAAQAQILKQTSDAQGDFGRTSDGLANQQRILAAEFENTKAALGEALLPVFQTVIGGLSDVAGAFNKLPDSAKSAIGGLAGIGTAATLGVGGLSLLIGTGMKVADTFKEFGKRVSLGTGPLSKLSGAARTADGSLTALGKTGAAVGGVLAGLVALEVADTIRSSIVNEADRLEKARSELEAALAGGGSTEEVLRAFSERAGADTAGTLQNIVEVWGKNLRILPGVAEETIESIERTFESLTIDEQGGIIQALKDYGAGLEVGSQAAKDNATLLANLEGRYDSNAKAAEKSAGATTKQAEASQEASDASDKLKAALAKLAFTQKLANLQFEVGAKRASLFGDAIENSTNVDNLLQASLGAGNALRNLRQTLGLIPEEAKASKDATNDASEALERLSDAAAAADPSLSDLGISMDSAAAGADAFNQSLSNASKFGTQLDAAVDLGEAFRALDRSARRLPATLDLTAISLGNVGRRQLEAIRDLRSLGAATNDYLTTLLRTGSTSDQVRQQAAGFRAELEAQLRQAGLSEEAIRQYVEAAALAPAQIETAIKLSGIESARFKLNAYLGLLEGKIPPQIATQVIAQIEADDLSGAAATLRNFAATNPVDIDFTPTGTDKLDAAIGKITDLPRKFDPLVAFTGGYTEAQSGALDAVLALGQGYRETLAELARNGDKKAVLDWAEAVRGEFAKTVSGLKLLDPELQAYYELLGIAPDQVNTAIKISFEGADLFALTTTIDLLESVDGLSPEVKLQISDALLKGDYEKVKELLSQRVDAKLGLDPLIGEETYGKITARWRASQTDTKLGLDPLIGEETYSKITERWRSTQTDTKLGADTSEADTKLGEFFDRATENISKIKFLASIGLDSLQADIASAVGEIASLTSGMWDGIKNSFRNALLAVATGWNGLAFPEFTLPSVDIPGLGTIGGGTIGGWELPDITIPEFATGGLVRGKGTGTSDDIPARLSDGEYVIKAAAVDRIGVPALNAINAGMTPTALGNDKGEAALLNALRELSVAVANIQGGDQIVVNEARDAFATAEELLRSKLANQYLAGRR